VRLVHWTFVALIPALWWTGEHGDVALHTRIGLAMAGLVMFRLLWGLVGTDNARFATFVKGPGALLAYLRGQPRPGAVAGHNPLGALSVLALLALLAAQVGFGLFAQDTDGLESGPLSHYVSYDGADAARGWHALGFNLLLALIALHLAAIAWYRLRGNNLLSPMLTGRKPLAEGLVAPRPVGTWRILACGVLAAGFVWWLSLGAPLPGLAG
jgi:cytochrome b